MAYLESKGVRTIELDGVFKAASLYRRLGFRDKYLSLRFLRPPTHPPTAGKPLIPDPTEEIVEFDRERTGIARRRILRRYLEQYKDRVFVTRNPELCAYAFVRPRSDGAVSVGPLVSADNRSAQRLLSGIAVKYARQHVSIGVPEAQRSMVTHLVDLGFRYLAPSLRMYRGEKKHYESHIYGILSPEKG
jgi:hypothetical protein